VDAFTNLGDDGPCLGHGRGGIQAVNIHLDEERGELLVKTFIRKYIRGNLDCGTWVRAQKLSLCRHYCSILRRDLEYLELNEVVRGKPAYNEGGILCTDMHREHV
jgi:hypothetical protein